MSGRRIKQITSDLCFNFTIRKSFTVLVTSPTFSGLYNMGHRSEKREVGCVIQSEHIKPYKSELANRHKAVTVAHEYKAGKC